MSRILTPLLALLLAGAPALAQGPNPNARFGLPAPATPEPESREAYLIARPQ
jgi:hypothetical protein